MLDYKDIITKHYALGMKGGEIAATLGNSKSGVNDFLRAFEQCEALSYPLPEGITNYGIAELVYGTPAASGRDLSYELPDFSVVNHELQTRQNMTLVYQWNKYVKRCRDEERKPYQYRQFCELYGAWCKENYETAHFSAVIGQTMEIDFAGKTLDLIDRLTGEIQKIIIFVAVLPYSQYIYAEGMISTREPQWIEVNNHALAAFGGVPAVVVCDNCKQAVIANRDWIAPELNRDFAEWAEHNHTVILPAKVRKPKYKSSVENAVGILESGILLTLEDRDYFDLSAFNRDLWTELNRLNRQPFKKKEHNRYYYWEEEKAELMPLPAVQYQYTERATPKVSSDFHVRFDNAYYSVDKAWLHKRVSIRATADTVRIYSMTGAFIREWPRAQYKGQWQTDPSDLPPNYKEFSEWNAPYFTRKAMTVGPMTVEVIKRVLKSRRIEIQTYRQCMGILSFTKRYSHKVLEECCRRALELDKTTYTFIKNSIKAVSDELQEKKSVADRSEERNRGGFVMDPSAMDVDRLLSRTKDLKDRSGKEAD